MSDFHHVYKEHIAKGGFLSRAGFSDRNTGRFNRVAKSETTLIHFHFYLFITYFFTLY